MIIARSDARAVVSLQEAIDRANLALAAGADMVFVEATETFEEVAAVPRLVNGPCMLNVVPGGKTPAVRMDDAQAMGYRLGYFSCPAVQDCGGGMRRNAGYGKEDATVAHGARHEDPRTVPPLRRR